MINSLNIFHFLICVIFLSSYGIAQDSSSITVCYDKIQLKDIQPKLFVLKKDGGSDTVKVVSFTDDLCQAFKLRSEVEYRITTNFNFYDTPFVIYPIKGRDYIYEKEAIPYCNLDVPLKFSLNTNVLEESDWSDSVYFTNNKRVVLTQNEEKMLYALIELIVYFYPKPLYEITLSTYYLKGNKDLAIHYATFIHSFLTNQLSKNNVRTNVLISINESEPHYGRNDKVWILPVGP